MHHQVLSTTCSPTPHVITMKPRPAPPSPPPCSEGRDLLLRNYRRGRKAHWSGFSSASPSREVALGFACAGGPGGVLLRVDSDLLPQGSGSRARDIRALSALRVEEEASGPARPALMLVGRRAACLCLRRGGAAQLHRVHRVPLNLHEPMYVARDGARGGVCVD
jgi:hypothetical protein